MKKLTKKKENELNLIAEYIGCERCNFYEILKFSKNQQTMDKIKKYSDIKIETITDDDIRYIFNEINGDLLSYDCYYVDECLDENLDFEKIRECIEDSIDEAWRFLSEYDNHKKIGVL